MRWVLPALLALGCAGPAQAQVPRQINYQGNLTDGGGTPINATLQMAFRLYDVASGGAPLYSETQNVTVSAGVFNALIGTVTTLTLPFDKPYWLGLTVGAEVVEMAPRQALAASPYALRALSAEVLAATATVPGSQVSGAITSATLPAASLTGTIAPANLPASQQLPAIACAPTQIPKWNGSAWACAADDSGGIAGGTLGQVLTGTGGAPAWSGSPSFGGNLTLANPSTATTGSIMKGGNRFLHNFGTGNTFVGENAGNVSLSGAANTASGVNALAASTVGQWNTANGFQALAANQAGSYNTALGMETLVFNIDGNNNTAAGTRALASSLGSNNIGIGFNGGSSLTTGDNNIAIGNDGMAGESNKIRIGTSQTDTYLTGIVHGNGSGLTGVSATIADGSITSAKLAPGLTLAGNVGIGTTSPLVRLHVTPGTAKTDPALTRAFAILTNEPLGAIGDPNNPFGLDVRLIGGATLANRSVYIQSTDFNTAGGGNILLQAGGGNVGVGTLDPASPLTVAGVIQSTSGGVKFPDGATQTKALANCSTEGDVAVMHGGAWVCRSAQRYLDNGNGTVTDQTTGLMWEKKVACAVADFTRPHCLLNTYTSTGTGPRSPTETNTCRCRRVLPVIAIGGFRIFTSCRALSPCRTRLVIPAPASTPYSGQLRRSTTGRPVRGTWI